MNRSSKSTYDSFGRVVKVERAGVTAIDYIYDIHGRVSKISQGERFVEFG